MPFMYNMVKEKFLKCYKMQLFLKYFCLFLSRLENIRSFPAEMNALGHCEYVHMERDRIFYAFHTHF